MRLSFTCLLAALLLGACATPPVRPLPSAQAIAAAAQRAMAQTQAKGLAIAVIDDGRVVHVASFGQRNERGEPLQPQTVM